MKGEKFLKVTGIIMIIGGIISIILGIVAFIGVAALGAMVADSSGSTVMLYLAAGLLLVSGIFQLIAGITGVKNCQKPEKAGTCIVLGIIVAALCVVGQILNVIDGTGFNFTSVITGVALPVLYIVGAVMSKNELAK